VIKSHLFRSAGVIGMLCAAVTLSACSGDVPLEPAQDANDPHCADVIVRLPSDVAGLQKRSTNAQSTGAWGDPDAVVLRCGIKPSGPTTDSCVSVNGVDWIVDDSKKPTFRFEAYGRSPGLEVLVDSREVSGTDALLDLSSLMSYLPQKRHCSGVEDELDQDQLGDDSASGG
jgi:hypothetical protein